MLQFLKEAVQIIKNQPPRPVKPFTLLFFWHVIQQFICNISAADELFSDFAPTNWIEKQICKKLILYTISWKHWKNALLSEILRNIVSYW